MAFVLCTMEYLCLVPDSSASYRLLNSCWMAIVHQTRITCTVTNCKQCILFHCLLPSPTKSNGKTKKNQTRPKFVLFFSVEVSFATVLGATTSCILIYNTLSCHFVLYVLCLLYIRYMPQSLQGILFNFLFPISFAFLLLLWLRIYRSRA